MENSGKCRKLFGGATLPEDRQEINLRREKNKTNEKIDKC